MFQLELMTETEDCITKYLNNLDVLNPKQVDCVYERVIYITRKSMCIYIQMYVCRYVYIYVSIYICIYVNI